MKFGHLILRKIFKFVATRCQIQRLKCNKFDFGWGSAPDFSGGVYSAPPDLLIGFTTFKRGEWKRRRTRGWDGRGEGRGRNKKGGKRRGPQKLVHTPDVRNPEKYNDCRTDLIGGGGNTDVCPGRQTPSRRHLSKSSKTTKKWTR